MLMMVKVNVNINGGEWVICKYDNIIVCLTAVQWKKRERVGEDEKKWV
jgi:hypothetical protein